MFLLYYWSQILLLILFDASAVVSYGGPLSFKENIDLQNSCGKRPGFHPKAMNSLNATIAEAPWVVSIVTKTGSLCSGSLISSRHILTAAHCIMGSRNSTGQDALFKRGYEVEITIHDPYKVRVILGDECSGRQNKNCEENIKGKQKVTVGKTLSIYSEFIENDDMHDIAVMELEVDLRSQVPICLSTTRPERNQEVEAYGYGAESMESGDKRVDILQKITQVVVICTEPPWTKKIPWWAGEHVICTGSRQRQRQYQCGSVGLIFYFNPENESRKLNPYLFYGDSGGSLVSKDSTGRYFLQGVQSMGQACPITRSELYKSAAVASFVDWICRKTGVCPAGHHHSPEENISVITKERKIRIHCDRDQMVLSHGGTRALCLQIFTLEPRVFNASSAATECESWGGSLASIRDDREMRAIVEWENTYGNYKNQFPKEYESFLVNAQWDDKIQDFRWLGDRSIVRKDDDRTFFPWGRKPVDRSGFEAKCLSMRFVTWYRAVYEAVSCKARLYSIACSKKPVIVY